MTFAGFQGASNGGQRCANLRSRVNRRSDLPYNGTVWRFDRLLLKNWRTPFEVPWKTAKTLAAVGGGGGAGRHQRVAGGGAAGRGLQSSPI